MKSSLFEQPQRILVTGCRAPAATDLVRWLSHQGHEVTTSDSILLPAARFSRSSHHWVRYPSPRYHTNKFAHVIHQLARSHDLIWPCCEEVFWLSTIPAIPLFAPPQSLLLTLHHKGLLVSAVNAIGHAVRAPACLAPPANLATIPSGYIAKPCYGRFGHRNRIGPAAWHKPPAHEAWVLQSLVKGREICLYAIAREGQVIHSVCYRDPGRTRPGPCIVFQRCHDLILEGFLQVFIRRHNFTGQIGFDALIDENDQRWIIDCNPRLTSGLHLIFRPATEWVQLSLARKLTAFARRDAPDASTAPDGMTHPGDSLPFWLLPLSAGEIWCRFPSRLSSASTRDLQWP